MIKIKNQKLDEFNIKRKDSLLVVDSNIKKVTVGKNVFTDVETMIVKNGKIIHLDGKIKSQPLLKSLWMKLCSKCFNSKDE